MSAVTGRRVLRWGVAVSVRWRPALIALALGACAKPALAPSFPSPLLGHEAPGLGRSLDGVQLDLRALRGRVVVVDFFADYCAPCQHLLPALRELQAAHPEVAFVGVSLDERRSDAQQLIARYQLEFPVVHDRSRVVAGRFRVRELPVTFLIDQRGAVHWAAGPDHTPEHIEQVLESMLGGE